MKALKNKEKINSNNNEILVEITKELREIIEYIEINIINIENNDGKEKQNKKTIKLGVKRKNSIKIKDRIKLNENEEKKENLKNKKFKEIIDKFKRHSIEIVKKLNDILVQIYDYKNIRDELDINYIRIRKSLFGYRDGKKYFIIKMVIDMKEILKTI